MLSLDAALRPADSRRIGTLRPRPPTGQRAGQDASLSSETERANPCTAVVRNLHEKPTIKSADFISRFTPKKEMLTALQISSNYWSEQVLPSQVGQLNLMLFLKN